MVVDFGWPYLGNLLLDPGQTYVNRLLLSSSIDWWSNRDCVTTGWRAIPKKLSKSTPYSMAWCGRLGVGRSKFFLWMKHSD